jgi:4-hydroxymandelate oxidase
VGGEGVVDLTALMTLADFERAAEATMDKAGWAYVAGGAGSESGVRANVEAYQDIWLRPRVLDAVPDRPETEVSVLGQRLSMPVLLGPTSPQRMLHPDAELATARAAANAGIVSVVSTDSHYAFPDVAAVGGASCWFQLYPYQSLDCVAKMIAMAEEAGAGTIVLTVDAFHRPRRITTRRTRFQVPDTVDFGSLRLLGVLTGDVPPDARIDRLPLTWHDLEWIRMRVNVPLVVKGVLHPKDAARCVELGVDGIVVSNHGGRQLDGVIPTLPALADIAAEVGGRCTVLVDGGARSGVDVVKLRALGADAVCLGRPYLWGLRLAGQAGVAAVIDLVRQEIEDTLRQLGLPSVSEVRRDCVAWTGSLIDRVPREELT